LLLRSSYLESGEGEFIQVEQGNCQTVQRKNEQRHTDRRHCFFSLREELEKLFKACDEFGAK
jgi:hypothetical protein